mgnify:CR=1 FL=1
MDQNRDAADDQAHVERERGDQDVHMDVESGRARVVVERGGVLAGVHRITQELDQGADRRGEGERDHRSGEDPQKRCHRHGFARTGQAGGFAAGKHESKSGLACAMPGAHCSVARFSA